MSLNASTQDLPSPTISPPYRHDVDGLRAVAILLVVVYHVWIGRVSGGVDAFLMISAFFLTGSFVRRLEKGQPLKIVNQWVRTFKRLLPPAAVVLLGTLFAGLYFLPESRLTDFFRNIWASLFYVENWKLAGAATDYYADKINASPVQHFWSLSVQGQVFLLWPLIFLIVLFLVKRTRVGVRSASAVVLSLVFAASFIYSVSTTMTNQESAYFDTWARLWEFAAGALLAVALPWIRLPRWFRSILGWVGLAALIACGMVIDVQGGFPGYLALWPVLSVAAIIVSGTGDTEPVFVGRALSWKPLVALGRDAYGLYLIHWPILIFTLLAKGSAGLTFLDGLLIVAASLVGARLLTWLVDDRIRYAKWANASNLRGVLVIALSMMLVAGPTMFFHWSTHQEIVATKEKVAALTPRIANPGAASLTEGWKNEAPPYAPTIPLAGELESEWGQLPQSCEEHFQTSFGDFDAGCSALTADSPALTVVIVGDSHAQQWIPPLAEIGTEENWQIFSFLKGACPLNLLEPSYYDDEGFGYSCSNWMDEVFSLVAGLDPDVVITVGTRAVAANEAMNEDAGQDESLHPGQDAAVSALNERGVPVVLLRDNPRFTFNAYECAHALSEDATTDTSRFDANENCGVSRSRALALSNPADSMIRPGVTTVDMTDFICRESDCPATIGNVFVYLDDNHLTGTYSKTMAPALGPRLTAAVSQARSWE